MIDSFDVYTIVKIILIVSSCFQLVVCRRVDVDTKNRKCPSAKQSPEIRILEHGADFRFGDGRQLAEHKLLLECIAAYPIRWDFIPNHAIRYHTENRVVENSVDKNSFCYIEVITAEAFQDSGSGRSGNYTCKSVLKPELATWKYFHIRDNEKLFKKVGDDGIIYSELQNGTEWLVPCPANIKEFTSIHLYQYKNTDTTRSSLLVSLNSHEESRYDPKYGFLLRTSEFSRPEGFYYCEGYLNLESERINVELKNYNAIPSSNFVHYTNNNTIEIVCESDEDITIDLSQANNLKTIESSNFKSTSFKNSIKLVLQEDISPNLKGKQGTIGCTTVASKRILHYWIHDIRKSCNCTEDVSSSSEEIKVEKKDGSTYLNCGSRYKVEADPDIAYKYVSSPTMLNLALKNFNTLGLQDENNDGSHVDEDREGRKQVHVHLEYSSAVVFCNIDNITTVIRGISTLDGIEMNPISEKLNLPKNLQLDIEHKEVSGYAETNLVDYFTGDYANFVCSASRFYFTSPMKWTIHFKNGTDVKIQSGGETGNITETWTRYAIVSRSFTPITNEIEYISCSAPLINSAKWETVKWFTNQIQLGAAGIWKNSTKCSSSSKAPTIILKRFHPNEEKQNVLKLHNVTNSDLVLKSKNLKIELICRAEFPIEWRFNKDSWLSESKKTYFNEKGKSDETAVHVAACFESTVEITTYSISSTGEYSCRNRDSENVEQMKSYVYIYVDFEESPELMDTGEHRDVSIYEGDTHTIIPCKPNNPLAKVEIFHKESQGNYRKMKDTEYEEYSPKKGFTFKSSTLNKNSVYVCSVANSTNPDKGLIISLEYVNRYNESYFGEEHLGKGAETSEKSIAGYFETMNYDFKKIYAVLVFVLLIVICLLAIQGFIAIQSMLRRKKLSVDKLPLKNHIELNEHS